MPSTPMREVFSEYPRQRRLWSTRATTRFTLTFRSGPRSTKRRQICSACLVQEVSHWRLAGGGKIALSHIQRNILGFRSDMGPRRRTTAGVARKRCGANPDVETGAEGAKILRGPQRSNNMTPHIPEEFSTKLTDWSPFVIMGNTMPPRDPDEDEEDEDEEDEEEDRADEPPVVREPDED